jgi:hypothetical protein
MIYFVRRLPAKFGATCGSIFHVSVDGRGVRRLDVVPGDEEDPAVSPDVNRIAFTEWPAVAERGVASGRVVEGLDVAEDGEAGLIAAGPAAALDQLVLDRGDDAFGGGIVVGVATAAYTSPPGRTRAALCGRRLLVAPSKAS